MPRQLTTIYLLICLGLVGCKTAPTLIEKPVFVPVPAACLITCPFIGPSVIKTNGQLLESYRGRLDQVACLESRLACVRGVQPPPAKPPQ